MKIGFIGLGKMGQQMVVRLIEGGHEVVVTDLNKAAVELSVEAGATAAEGRAELVTALGEHPVVWIMIPAQFVDAEVTALLEHLPAGGVIIDGGNSDFTETKRRGETAARDGVHFIDVGTSGGVLGLKEGFSMMVGGDKDTVTKLRPIFEALSRPKGWAHFGPSGSGHYIKMIHNAIEYGMMEAYAEGYRLLKEGKDYPDLDLASISEVWEHGSIIQSHLNMIVGDVLKANPNLKGIDGFVAESGEARWTLDRAKSENIGLPAIQAAFDVRLASQQGETHFGTKLLAAMRNIFGGHAINKQ